MYTFVFELAHRATGAQRNNRLHVKAPTLWDAREWMARNGHQRDVLSVTTLPEQIMKNNGSRTP